MTASREGGFITFDFIFALMMVLGFTTVIFALTVTLSAVEVAQYITFAVSRAYVGAHETKELQGTVANQKFAEEMAIPIFKTAFNGGWFTLGKIQIGDFNNLYAQSNSSADNAVFWGARLTVDAKILRMEIPFLGRTFDDSSVGKATLSSYLMREVSNTECRENFNRARWDHIHNIKDYSGAPNNQPKLITDNGC